MTDIPKNTKATIKRLLGQQKGSLIVIVLATLVSIGLYAVTPLILGRAIDQKYECFRNRSYDSYFSKILRTYV